MLGRLGKEGRGGQMLRSAGVTRSLIPGLSSFLHNFSTNCGLRLKDLKANNLLRKTYCIKVYEANPEDFFFIPPLSRTGDSGCTKFV